MTYLKNYDDVGNFYNIKVMLDANKLEAESIVREELEKASERMQIPTLVTWGVPDDDAVSYYIDVWREVYPDYKFPSKEATV